MIKFLFGWRYSPDLSPEQCEEHYHRVHMELAKKAFTVVDGFVALAYNRVIEHTVNDYNRPERIPTPTDMDAFVELWFESQEKMQKAFANPVLRQMFEDHVNFMDCSTPANIKVYEVEEEVFLGRRPN